MTSSTDEPEDLVPPPDDLERASAAVRALFDQAGIARVVFVDDDFATSAEDVVAACAQLVGGASETTVFAGVDFSSPRELWESEVQALWRDLDDSARAIAGADVIARAFPEDEGGQLNAGALQPLIPDGIEFLPVSGRRWLDETRSLVLADAAETPTLVLFDRIFDKEDIGRDGLALLVDLYAADEDAVLWCGLLTHTVTKDNEDDERRQLAAEPGVRAERFVVASKLHMGPDPGTFPQAMKVALLSSPSSELASLVATAIASAVTNAADEVKKIAPVDFERLVFHISAEEGLWEPDTLLRLFNIHMRSALHTALHAQARIAELTEKLRAIASIATELGPAGGQAALRARKLHRRETYETPEHLGQLHLPIQLGDVFARTGNNKLYVLVAQPCDLMVRSDGRRAPELESVHLLPMSRVADNEADPPPSRLTDQFEFPGYFDDGASAVVSLKRVERVPIEALDFCVFNTDGGSVLDTMGNAPVGLWPSWRERHGVLKRRGAVSIAAIDAAPVDQKGHVKRAMFRCIQGSIVNPQIKVTTVSYNLKRVARVNEPYGRALLTKYTQYLARDAFERPLLLD